MKHPFQLQPLRLTLSPARSGLAAAIIGAVWLPGRAAAPQNAPSTSQNVPASSGAAPVLISELRAWGPRGAHDAFIELFNNSSEPLSLAGWSLRSRDAKGTSTILKMAPGTRIGARSHLLLVGRDYSLGHLTPGDAVILPTISGGVGLYNAKSQLIDAVGPTEANQSEREGAGLPTFAFRATPDIRVTPDTGSVEEQTPKFTAAPTPIPQFSLVRRALDGQPQDSNDNGRDFLLVGVTGALAERTIEIGVPGPENADSPPLRPIPALLPGARTPNAPWLHPIVLQTDPERTSMQRARRVRGPLKTYGTMTLRYRFVNTQAKTLQKLTFRVNSITAGPASQLPSPDVADVRLIRGQALSATRAKTAPISKTSPTSKMPHRTLDVAKAKLSSVPSQPLGGGWNALLDVPLPPGGLAPGARLEISFALGVERMGNYRLVLGSQHLNLLFEGHTEADLSPDANGHSFVSAPLQGVRSTVSEGSGATRSGSLPSSPLAGAAKPTPAPIPFVASFGISGNTEEGGGAKVPPPVPIKSSKNSS